MLEWDSISTYFDAVHLNWDPVKFTHSATVHCAVPASPFNSAPDKTRAVQLQLVLDPPSAVSQEVWVLMSRHEQSVQDKGNFVGLGVVARWGTAVETVGATRVDNAVGL